MNVVCWSVLVAIGDARETYIYMQNTGTMTYTCNGKGEVCSKVNIQLSKSGDMAILISHILEKEVLVPKIVYFSHKKVKIIIQIISLWWYQWRGLIMCKYLTLKSNVSLLVVKKNALKHL